MSFAVIWNLIAYVVSVTVTNVWTIVHVVYVEMPVETS